MFNIENIFDIGLYYLNPYALTPMVVAGVCLCLGIFVFQSDRSHPYTRTLLNISLTISIWVLSQAAMLMSYDVDSALFWAHVYFMAISLTSAAAVHLNTALTQRNHRQRSIIRFIYIQAIVLGLLSWHSEFFLGIHIGRYGAFPRAGMYMPILMLFVGCCFTVCFINFIDHFFKVKSTKKRQEIIVFMLAYLALLLSFVDVFVAFYPAVYPFGHLVLLGFILLMACHRLRTSHEMVDEQKSREISAVFDELRTTQLKLFESGKVSAVASLSAGLLHQLSQPITAIYGFSKFLKKEMDPKDKFYKPIELIDEQASSLKELLEDLMNLVRHRKIHKTNINVNHIIKKSIGMLIDELRIKRIVWDLDLDEDIPYVYVDSIHVQQIFMNIIVNAVYALNSLPQGAQRSFKISSYYEKQTNKACASFKDSGPGISEFDQKRVFEPFFSTKSKGSGIGLALCQDLIAEHGGQIVVESQPGQGANFIVKFPCASKVGMQYVQQ